MLKADLNHPATQSFILFDAMNFNKRAIDL